MAIPQNANGKVASVDVDQGDNRRVSSVAATGMTSPRTRHEMMVIRCVLLFHLVLAAVQAQQVTAQFLQPGSPACVFAGGYGPTMARTSCYCAPVFLGGAQFAAVVLSFSAAPSPVPLPPEIGVGVLIVNPVDVIMVAPMVPLPSGELVHEVVLDPNWAPIEWYVQVVVVTTQGEAWALFESYRFSWQ